MAYFNTETAYDSSYNEYNIVTLNISGSVQHKHATAEEWAASIYVPAEGEICVATDTGETRVGNGVDTWNNLPNPFVSESESAESNPVDTMTSIVISSDTNDYYIVFNTEDGLKNYKVNMYSFTPTIEQFAAIANLIAPLVDYEIDSICIEETEYVH